MNLLAQIFFSSAAEDDTRNCISITSFFPTTVRNLPSQYPELFLVRDRIYILMEEEWELGQPRHGCFMENEGDITRFFAGTLVVSLLPPPTAHPKCVALPCCFPTLQTPPWPHGPFRGPGAVLCFTASTVLAAWQCKWLQKGCLPSLHVWCYTDILWPLTLLRW